MKLIKALSILLFCAFGLAAFLASPRHTDARIATVGPPAQATGVVASDNWYYNKVGLRWDAIRGATTYRVFRNVANDPANAADVGTTPASFYFDATATQAVTYFYWVRAENSAGVGPLSQPDQGTAANGNFDGGTIPPLEPPLESPENPVTAAKAFLGKALFWDEQMSSTRTVACGTCHRPAAGGSDPRTAYNSDRSRNPGPDNIAGTVDDIFGSPGVVQNAADGSYSPNAIFGLREQVTPRKAPSYLNAGYSPLGLFWDGRATDEFRDPLTNNVLIPNVAALESQASGPPVAAGEMGHMGRDWNQVAARIQGARPLALATNIPAGLKTWIGNRTYPELFEEVYGSPDVTPARIVMAIATHERTLFSDQTPLDKAAAGIEPLTKSEQSGRQIFEANSCAACHLGSLLSDQAFHNISVRPPADDLGRGGVSGIESDNGAFKTPNLRNGELHPPYMHNGRFQTLEEVVEFYNRGGDYDAPNVDHDLIHPLDLSPQQRADLVAFLKRPLTDVRVRDELPPFDHPKLFTESDRAPVLSGSGRAGSGGGEPRVIVNSPGLIGNPTFVVGVDGGLGNSLAYLVIDSSDPGVGTSIPSSGSFIYQTRTLAGTGSGNGWTSVVFPIPNDQSLNGRTFYGRWYVTDAGAANGFSVSKLFSFKTFLPGAATRQSAPYDFDGDGRTDASVYRPSNNVWYLLRGTAGFAAYQFGANGDQLVPADYTGDGKTDVAIWRPSVGTWFILRSEDLTVTGGGFGLSGDIPIPGDFDGDGKADLAVYRPGAQSVFYIQGSSTGFQAISFGLAEDRPTLGDFDGDGKTDIAVYRPSQGVWYRINSSNGTFYAAQFGQAGDKIVPADYTGDGKTDLAVWRESTGVWFILRSEDNSVFGGGFGIAGDVPSPGDYDGDGKADFAVYRSGSQGIFYVLGTTNGFQVIPWGIAGDRPVPSVFNN